MSLLAELVNNWRQAIASDFTATMLKTAIVLWAIFVIFLVLFVLDNNKWLLAGIFLYEVLP